MKQFKRKQYIVDKGIFQYKFLLPFAISWLLATIISTSIFNVMVQAEIEDLLWKAHVTVQTTDEIIGEIFIYTISATLFLVFAFLNVACFYLKKKNNGVVIRMVNDLQMVATGDFSKRIMLRKKDAFQDVATSLNSFLEEKAERFTRLKTSTRDINAELRKIQIACANGSLQRYEIKQLNEKVSLLRASHP
ncbi:MAG: hypothetical protein KAQ71_00230 [Desulfobulbaceae bacterium]|nr:hypothetical protein [Desulfobulbaceae bacterium]